MKDSTSKNKILKNTAAFLFWIAVWYVISVTVGQELILPSPFSVLKELIRLCTEGRFWLSAASSLLRIFGGFLIGVILATFIAAMTVKSPLFDTLFSPLIKVIRAVPVASFIILVLLWVGKAFVPAFISALMVIPVIWGNTVSAIRGTDPLLLEMARAYKFGKAKTLKAVYIPSVFPSWTASFMTALGLSWKAGVAAEVLALPKTSIGAELYYSKIYLETPSLFAWTAVVILLSFMLEKGLTVLLKRGKRA